MSSEPTVGVLPGGVHITVEVQLESEVEPGADAAQLDTSEATDAAVAVLKGAADAAGHVLGYAWDAIMPDDSAPPAESEEE